MLSLHVLTLFPEQFRQFFLKGLIQRAYDNRCFVLNTIDLRQFGIGQQKKVDHYPFSEKKGMLLRSDVVYKALISIEDYQNMRIIYTCPKGKVFNQHLSTSMVNDGKDIILISGYYEGIDNRIFDMLPIEQISIGDYIVNSGDCAVAVIAESLVRQCSGVLGNPDCVEEDSHFSNFLEAPQYTQPVVFNDKHVPDILRSGDHAKIKQYKYKQALQYTLLNRPDLLNETFNQTEKHYLTTVIKEMVVNKDER